MIDYRILYTMDELEEIVDLEIAVWGLNPRDAVPSALMHVLVMGGGLVLGAYDDKTLVGLLLALPVMKNQEWILWSHMTGIHPEYRSQGIGIELKKLQRQWALANGYHKIGWTFDPLQRGNAHFNFHLLGKEAALYTNTYHVNFYGEMNDDINRGLPSDRIEVIWSMNQPSLHDPISYLGPLILYQDEQQAPVIAEDLLRWDGSAYRVAVPHNLDALRRTSDSAVLAWRVALRTVLQAAFRYDYAIVNFTCRDDVWAYSLKKMDDSL